MAEEQIIESKLTKEVKKRGGLCLKFISPNYAGVPDRLILLPIAKIAFVEVKAPGKKPRRLQIKRHEELRQLGFKVYVLDNVDDIGGIIDDLSST
jgi:hypothetical protein